MNVKGKKHVLKGLCRLTAGVFAAVLALALAAGCAKGEGEARGPSAGRSSMEDSVTPSFQPQGGEPRRLPVTFGTETVEVAEGEEPVAARAVESLDELPRFPAGEEASFMVSLEGQTVFSGDCAEQSLFEPGENGLYRYEISQPTEGKSARFSFLVRLSLPPEVSLSAEELPLGEAASLYVRFAGDAQSLSLKTDLACKPFFADTPDGALALIPISYYTQPGEYSVEVYSGEEKIFSSPIAVVARDFVVQDLRVDEEVADETVNNTDAIDEWNTKIEPLKAVADPEKYWEGPFLMPIEGKITTEYGTIRYTNGSDKASRHGALDIAAKTGTPVPAANAGRVQFAQFIQMSGNVVVIEHGQGLKTWYFHMSEILVEEGQMVKQGDIIGKVGATGFVTGPHLHFGVSVGGAYLNPDTVCSSDIFWKREEN